MDKLKDAIAMGLKQHELHFSDNQIDEILKNAIPAFNQCIAMVAFKGQSQSAGDSVNDVMGHDFIAEVQFDNPTYLGFDSPRNMSNFVNRFHMYPTYQIIFEDKQQKLVFQYVGDDHIQLERELAKLYPRTKIDRTYDDIIIGIAYPNYELMNSEFDNMKHNLTDINPVIARQCVRKELEHIEGVARQAIKSRLIPQRSLSIMIHIDELNITNCALVGTMNGGNINMKKTASREELHSEWVRNNPPGKDEQTSLYYKRAKGCLANACRIQTHAQLMLSLGYDQIHPGKKRYWVRSL